MRRFSHFVKFLLLILLATQTASFVCGAQCAQSASPEHHGMDHCAMPAADHPSLQTCAHVQTHCASDLFVRAPEKLQPPVLHVEPVVELTVNQPSAGSQSTAISERSTLATALLLAPLRI